MSYGAYLEVQRLRELERKQQVLALLESLRQEVRAHSLNLTAAEAYRHAGFGDQVIAETLVRDADFAAQ